MVTTVGSFCSMAGISVNGTLTAGFRGVWSV